MRTYEGTKAIEPDHASRSRCARSRSRARCARRGSAPHGPKATSTAGTKEHRRPDGALALDALVDDNAVNQEVAVAMLEESHCRVTLAHDGQAAVCGTERRFDSC